MTYPLLRRTHDVESALITATYSARAAETMAGVLMPDAIGDKTVIEVGVEDLDLLLWAVAQTTTATQKALDLLVGDATPGA